MEGIEPQLAENETEICSRRVRRDICTESNLSTHVSTLWSITNPQNFRTQDRTHQIRRPKIKIPE